MSNNSKTKCSDTTNCNTNNYNHIHDSNQMNNSRIKGSIDLLNSISELIYNNGESSKVDNRPILDHLGILSLVYRLGFEYGFEYR